MCQKHFQNIFGISIIAVQFQQLNSTESRDALDVDVGTVVHLPNMESLYIILDRFKISLLNTSAFIIAFLLKIGTEIKSQIYQHWLLTSEDENSKNLRRCLTSVKVACTYCKGNENMMSAKTTNPQPCFPLKARRSSWNKVKLKISSPSWIPEFQQSEFYTSGSGSPVLSWAAEAYA